MESRPNSLHPPNNSFDSLSRCASFCSVDQQVEHHSSLNFNNNLSIMTSPNITPPTTMVDLYVVQKCWFAGTHVPPSVDYRRLLPCATNAEQVAYQSAHLYANGKPVRTIQLQKNGAGYGFLASGMLFWVRHIRAISTNGQSQIGEAHGIVQDGILGGNPHARRTAPSWDDTVAPFCFVGPHSSHAAARCLQQQPPGGAARQVQWFPVGPPATLEQLRQEWPDHAHWNNNRMAQNHRPHDNVFRSVAKDVTMNVSSTSSSSLDNESPSNNNSKRGGTENDSGLLWFSQSAQQQQQLPAGSQPPAKRACRTTSSEHASFLNEIYRNNKHRHDTAAPANMMLE